MKNKQFVYLLFFIFYFPISEILFTRILFVRQPWRKYEKINLNESLANEMYAIRIKNYIVSIRIFNLWNIYVLLVMLEFIFK